MLKYLIFLAVSVILCNLARFYTDMVQTQNYP